MGRYSGVYPLKMLTRERKPCISRNVVPVYDEALQRLSRATASLPQVYVHTISIQTILKNGPIRLTYLSATTAKEWKPDYSEDEMHRYSVIQPKINPQVSYLLQAVEMPALALAD
ncbi:hypothetical protein [Chitinophaga nivalis]|uniref:Uncharacterized protein n=1 Tax=Chitinophaga nivalis TaxID=2991709 RepID=A0ABT3INB5_9BACT|nr:hypothetical protein [Chitinophaga nivalis]MCW3464848.1 hypothetical protein [Chitinophaga nivalis]MCW3485461.1 hypothetical protein [Chitinophaga nivalis]